MALDLPPKKIDGENPETRKNMKVSEQENLARLKNKQTLEGNNSIKDDSDKDVKNPPPSPPDGPPPPFRNVEQVEQSDNNDLKYQELLSDYKKYTENGVPLPQDFRERVRDCVLSHQKEWEAKSEELTDLRKTLTGTERSDDPKVLKITALQERCKELSRRNAPLDKFDEVSPDRQLNDAQFKLDKRFDDNQKQELSKAYKKQLLWPAEKQTIAHLNKELLTQKNALKDRCSYLENILETMRSNGNVDSQEYFSVAKELKLHNKQIESIDSYIQNNRNMQIEAGLQKAEELGEKNKNGDPPKMSEEDAKKSEKLLENAQKSILENIADWENEKKNLNPSIKEDKAKIKKLDEMIQSGKDKLSSIEDKLCDVRDIITDIEQKDINKLLQEVKAAQEVNDKELLQKLLPVSAREKVGRYVSRLEKAKSHLESELGMNFVPTPKLKSSLRKDEKEAYDHQKNCNQQQLKQIKEKLKCANEIADIIQDNPSEAKQKEQRTPLVDSQIAVSAEVAMAKIKVLKDVFYNLDDSGQLLKDLATVEEKQVKKESVFAAEENNKGTESEEKVQEGVSLSTAGELGDIMSKAKDGSVTGAGVGLAKIICKAMEKRGIIFDTKDDAKKKMFDIMMRALDDVGAVISAIEKAKSKPADFLKSLPKYALEMVDKTFSVAENFMKGTMNLLLEDRYGEGYGDHTDFICASDRIMYQLVKPQAQAFYEKMDGVKNFVYGAAIVTDTLDGMGEQYEHL